MSCANKDNYNFTPEEADELWVDTFGYTAIAYDALGHEIHRNKFSDQSEYGWEIDHIWPKSELEDYGVTADIINSKQNLQPLQWKANRIKSDNFPAFVIKYINGSRSYCYTLATLDKLVKILFPEPNENQHKLIVSCECAIIANQEESIQLNR